MKRRALITAAGLAAPAYLAFARMAPRWPDRPVKLVVAWPPGGSADTIARIIQTPVSEIIGQSLVIENRGGASGSIGAMEVARAAPDGYTFLMVYDTQATNESVMELPVKTMRDFAPVSLTASGPMVLVAGKDTPYRAFADVVQAAQRKPGEIAYATSGVGGLAHVATTLLQQMNDFRILHVPYRGGGPALQAALSHEVPLFMTNALIVNAYIRSETLYPLGVTTRARTDLVPNCPSFNELGLQDFEAPTWWGVLAPAGTPEAVVQTMSQAIAEALRRPEVRQKIVDLGADVRGSTPAEFGTFLTQQIEKWAQVIEANGIRMDS